MKDVPEAALSSIEDLRRRIGRAAFAAVGAGLSAGILLFLLGQPSLSSAILAFTLCLLLALPVVNVLAVLAEEVGRRDWGFAGLALAVLAMLAYAVAERVLGAPAS